MDSSGAAPATGGHAPLRAPEPAATAVLRVEGLGIGFGKRRVLADLHFDIPARGITVLMGPGGAGKSTLLHFLSGLPSSPRRFHDGQALYFDVPIETGARRPALVQQRAQLLMGRLVDMLSTDLRSQVQATPVQLRQMIIERLHQLGVPELEDALDRVVADLSTVDVRIATLLQAAGPGSDLLLIDEPTHGLVEADSDRILRLIEQLSADRACLVTTHNQRHARRLAQRAILLAGGRIQVDADAEPFFANAGDHPVLGQFLRTGSCSVPGLDATPEQLTDDATQAPSPALATGHEAAMPAAVAPAAPSAVAAPAEVAPAPSTGSASAVTTPAAAAPLQGGGASENDTSEPDLPALAPSTSEFPPLLNAPPSSQGPTGFRWLVPGRIAGCAKPGVVSPVDHDLALLKRMGITLLINLTEHDFPADALARHGLKGFAVKIEDRRAPPLLWAKLLLAKMERFLRDGENIAVHCLAGLGRTGTVLCGWLIREGLTAEEALRRLRSIDPGFVQSDEQEQLLAELENNLLIRTR